MAATIENVVVRLSRIENLVMAPIEIPMATAPVVRNIFDAMTIAQASSPSAQ